VRERRYAKEVAHMKRKMAWRREKRAEG